MIEPANYEYPQDFLIMMTADETVQSDELMPASCSFNNELKLHN